MDLKAKIIEQLKQYPKKTIDFFSLQSMSGGGYEKQELKAVVEALLADKVLIILSKNPNLTISSKFRIDKTALYKEEWALIRRMELELDSRIHFDYYYKYPQEIEKDKEILQKIHHSIQEETIFEELYLPELSLRLVGDEKWLEYKEGKQFLKKIGLWERFTVGDRYEPIAFALNPVFLSNVQMKSAEDRIYYHLIVENKTTFKQVMNILVWTELTTVIYGQGYKIISSCRMLEDQLPLEGKHQILYFGDFDKKGIEIFDALTRQIEVRLHQELYQALLKKTAVRGHENQNCAKEKIERFCSQFEGAKELIQLIENGSYLPQEMLSEEEMKKVLVRGQNDRL
ncbi:hypothetical protein EII17_09430 [Clostridiales bacterium COT073_COT-073]|nr:hypothetical protein EII17_09430 [Clostridiales bacterium COT073_COT-073]